MRRLLACISFQLSEDAATAEALTVCRRRGTIARAIRIPEGSETFENIWYSVNGSSHCSSTKGGCGCVHAEQRLIPQLFRMKVVGKLAMLTTIEPCEGCANLIVESQLFSSVFFKREYDSNPGRRILVANGIQVVKA